MLQVLQFLLLLRINNNNKFFALLNLKQNQFYSTKKILVSTLSSNTE